MTKISSFLFFFFNATASTEIYTLSLHYALPIFASERLGNPDQVWACAILRLMHVLKRRSEEHTSELQSHSDVVCGLLLEKKKGLAYQIEQRVLAQFGGGDFGDVVLRQHVERRARDAQFFFFNDTATTEIYTLSLHDALPI